MTISSTATFSRHLLFINYSGWPCLDYMLFYVILLQFTCRSSCGQLFKSECHYLVRQVVSVPPFLIFSPSHPFASAVLMTNSVASMPLFAHGTSCIRFFGWMIGVAAGCDEGITNEKPKVEVIGKYSLLIFLWWMVIVGLGTGQLHHQQWIALSRNNPGWIEIQVSHSLTADYSERRMLQHQGLQNLFKMWVVF